MLQSTWESCDRRRVLCFPLHSGLEHNTSTAPTELRDSASGGWDHPPDSTASPSFSLGLGCSSRPGAFGAEHQYRAHATKSYTEARTAPSSRHHRCALSFIKLVCALTADNAQQSCSYSQLFLDKGISVRQRAAARCSRVIQADPHTEVHASNPFGFTCRPRSMIGASCSCSPRTRPGIAVGCHCQ